MLKNTDRSCPQCCIWKEDPLGQLVTQRNQVPPLGGPLWLPPTLVNSIISKDFHPFIFSFFHLSIFFRAFIHSASIQKKVRSVSRSVMSDSLCQGLQPTRLLCPWDFPGKNTGVGCHFLLQGIFPTQGSNSGLLHCRQILYHLRHQGSPHRCYNS